MNPISRRESLKTVLFGAMAAGMTIGVLPKVVEAAPAAIAKDLAARTDHGLKEEIQWGPPPPRWRRRRRRRWVCWWRRGRRVCGWRYYW